MLLGYEELEKEWLQKKEVGVVKKKVERVSVENINYISSAKLFDKAQIENKEHSASDSVASQAKSSGSNGLEQSEEREIAEEDEGSSGSENKIGSDGCSSSLDLQEEQIKCKEEKEKVEEPRTEEKLQEEEKEQNPTDSVLESSEKAGSKAAVMTLDEPILYPDLEEECMESRREEETLLEQDEVSTEDEELESKGQTSSLNVDEDESSVGPSVALESKDEEPDLEFFGSHIINWYKEQMVCEEEKKVVETEDKREIAEEDKGSSGNEYETASDGYCSFLELQEEEEEDEAEGEQTTKEILQKEEQDPVLESKISGSSAILSAVTAFGRSDGFCLA
ncbi:hypothetical protein WMY93_020845 [Mugilogobius chulae]|uniref:Uncharacterized protein n=1 Tax=Mugilogobius chulae TaxID=88201 RepID=A0AAW0NA59_9GOBI